MKIDELATMIEGKVVAKHSKENHQITHAFTSDLMSDVLTINHQDSTVLLTGLANVQTIRTAEMANLCIVVLVRGKKASPDMIEIAMDNDIVIIETKFSAFRASAVLFNAGVQSLF